MTQPGGLHHIHKRKRVHQNLKPYPHPDKWINFLDRFLIVVAILGPLSTVPQLIEIYINRKVSGISILTWELWVIIAIPWLIYGVVHREKPLIISYTIWIIMELLVVIGILLYS